MREPKFVPGERVMIYSPGSPYHLNVGFVTEVKWSEWEDHAGEDLEDGYGYKTDADNLPLIEFWSDDELRKLPPETPATFDASIWVPNKETVK